MLTRPSGHPSLPSPGGTPVVITAIGGTAGVGKTALAVYWARQATPAFPDGQLYINLRGFGPTADPLPPAEALCEFLDALHVPATQIPARLEARQALYRGLLPAGACSSCSTTPATRPRSARCCPPPPTPSS